MVHGITKINTIWAMNYEPITVNYSALRASWVGERSCCSEVHDGSRDGAARSENAGMSSVSR